MKPAHLMSELRSGDANVTVPVGLNPNASEKTQTHGGFRNPGERRLVRMPFFNRSLRGQRLVL